MHHFAKLGLMVGRAKMNVALEMSGGRAVASVEKQAVVQPDETRTQSDVASVPPTIAPRLTRALR